MIIKKYVFGVFFIAIFCFEQKAHTMKKIIKNKIKNFDSKFYNTHASKSAGYIRKYNHKIDQNTVGKIVTDHIHALTTVHMMLDIPKAQANRPDRIEEASRKIVSSFQEEAESSNNKTIVYCIDEIPIGFISYLVDNPKFISFTNNTSGKINFLAISKQHQGIGAGKALITKAINDCKENGAKSIVLYTTCHVEEKTKKFYENHNFFDFGSMTYRGDSTWKKSLKETKPFDLFEWITRHKEQDRHKESDRGDYDNIHNLADIFNQLSICEEK